MRFALVLLSLLVPVAAGAQTPGGALERGLAAEGAGQFETALAIYLDVLGRDPLRTDLWVRVADIHARFGRQQDGIGALARAAAASPRDAALHVRLSEAYAEAGNADAALAAIEVAVALAPDCADLLRRRATLATWHGAYDRAQESYRGLLRLDPGDADAMLGLARTSAWAGDTDRAVAMYRKYLTVRSTNQEAWIELARAEGWRGNFAASWDVLDQYRGRFGESPEYSRERAAVLARGGRPRAATPLIERLLAAAPGDYGLNLSRTIALAARQRRGDALAASDAIERQWPGQPETRGARSLVRVAVASTGEPRASYYSDSDGLRVARIDPRVSAAMLDGTRLDAGYERADLRARPGSGLEQVGGATDASHQLAWIGLVQRAGLFTLRGHAGYAAIADRDRFAYLLSATLVSDAVRLSAARESGYFVVSPRTVGLGLTRLTHRMQLEWAPSFRHVVAVEGAVDELSDGNRRWDVIVAPRRSIARTQWLNLDLGVQLRQFGTTRDLDNGYYDPSRYESYTIVAFPYWKASESTGLGGMVAVGAQRDEHAGSFGLGGSAAVEATFGIYRDWMLKLNGSTTLNDRLQSGAFRGYGGQLVLVRRF
jgi:tetratricopeptide (TPR) repeat protein